MAPHRVFDIPELLDLILTQVPVSDVLFSAQKVCRAWYFAVQHLVNSPKYQQEMYLLPRLGEDVWAVTKVPEDITEFTTTSVRGLFEFEPGVEPILLSNILVPLEINSLLFNTTEYQENWGSLDKRAVPTLLSFVSGHDSRSTRPSKKDIHVFPVRDVIADSIRRSDGCESHPWMKMYLTQPPVHTALLDLQIYSARDNRDQRLNTIGRLEIPEEEDGITLGHVVAEIRNNWLGFCNRSFPSSVDAKPWQYLEANLWLEGMVFAKEGEIEHVRRSRPKRSRRDLTTAELN